ncbi:MAG: hypothetical protein M1817_001050 [Caeruleum heppii]|nr:MAG: hypothetical protein M1817_001050 [Caeruleum heppii]
MSQRSTLVKPPPVDLSKSPIENVLELRPLSDIGPDIFTNARPLWHPPGARGIFGGAVIAQCLSAAQLTVPEHFTVHSMHCYFVLAGDSEIPVLYHVEHVREGKSFATRTVQARQKGKCIFTTTMSFVRENSGGKRALKHATPMPTVELPQESLPDMRFGEGTEGPFQSQHIPILNEASPNPHEKRTRQWMQARGNISSSGGHQAHLNALAYMSDSYFIGTVARVHDLWRVSPSGRPTTASSSASSPSTTDPHASATSPSQSASPPAPRAEIGMMVSLDHTIFFHSPRDFRADEWIFSEMDSPWAGDGRGLVLQRIFSKDGALIATCVQEGLARLKQDPEPLRSRL